MRPALWDSIVRRLVPDLRCLPDDAERRRVFRAAVWESRRGYGFACLIATLIILTGFSMILPGGGISHFAWLPGWIETSVVGVIILLVTCYPMWRRYAADVRLAIRRRLMELGVPICTRCGYDLRGHSAEVQCPECGEAVATTIAGLAAPGSRPQARARGHD